MVNLRNIVRSTTKVKFKNITLTNLVLDIYYLTYKKMHKQLDLLKTLLVNENNQQYQVIVSIKYAKRTNVYYKLP